MKQLLTAAIVLMCVLLASCWGEEDYTLSPTAQLRFSADTLAFDTVIAGQPTGTKMLDIYNDASQALRIKAAYLEKGRQSLWRLNLDGEFLQSGRAEAIPIAAGDSVRLFAEMTAPITGQDAPQAYEEYLVFELESGVRQRVLLNAMGQDVEQLKALTISQATTLSSARPYQILDSLVVAPGATLTLAAGTRLYFQPRASLIVRGRLLAEGTLERPIVMRGDRLGNMFTHQAYDRIPNQWGGLLIASSSKENVLNFCDIHSGAFGIRCEKSDPTNPKLFLHNSIVHNTKGHALEATLCHIEATNTQITNAGGDCVRLVGGQNRFLHCTIAQFYPFAGNRGVALSYTNEHDNVPAPLTEARFVNCLITGYNTDDLAAAQSTRYKDAPFVYHFQNCLLNTPKVVNSEQVVACLFEEDAPETKRRAKHFFPEFDLKKLLFTFALSPQSLAVGKADVQAAQQLPLDRLGRARLADGRADIGCYETPTLQAQP